MGESSRIEWTENTWNPWAGCDMVSPGCDNCYMFRDQRRYGNDPEIVRRTKDATFNAPLKWHRKLAPGQKAMVFTCSWSDWFHKSADEWRPEAWQIIKNTPNLIYQILTKRPVLIDSRLPPDWGSGYPNVWLGVSAEDAEWWGRRVPILRSIPAAVRFVSYEPALGSCRGVDMEGVDWVIVGGESGPGARAFDVEWAREMIAACRATQTACFVKQLGAVTVDSRYSGMPGVWIGIGLKDKKGGDISEWPQDVRVREWPKAT